VGRPEKSANADPGWQTGDTPGPRWTRAQSVGDTRAMIRPTEPQPDVAHYGDGAVQSTGFMLDGEMHGHWEFFRKDGSVMRTGEFDRGRQVGVWQTFDRTGRLVKETDFSKR
jgi:hypothetical protein